MYSCRLVAALWARDGVTVTSNSFLFLLDTSEIAFFSIDVSVKKWHLFTFSFLLKGFPRYQNILLKQYIYNRTEVSGHSTMERYKNPMSWFYAHDNKNKIFYRSIQTQH